MIKTKKQSRLNLHHNVCAPLLILSFQSPSNPPTTIPPTTIPLLQSSATNGSTSNNNGLIIGLTVGLIVPFIIFLILLILLLLFLKSKKAARTKKKPVSRATAVGQKPGDSLSNRVQPRNLRAVRLAPIAAASTSALPDVPVKTVAPAVNSSLSYPNSNLRAPSKGIPVRLDPIR